MATHDIYNPPPAPVAWEEPPPEPLAISSADIAWLLGLCALLVPPSVWAWIEDPLLGAVVTTGGLFVILESWFSGLAFLRRHPDKRPVGRGLIFLAALVPWLIGVGFTASLMWLLFWLSDLAS
jgi:hypothetical protein